MLNNIKNQFVGYSNEAIKWIVNYFSLKRRSSVHAILLNLYKSQTIWLTGAIKTQYEAFIVHRKADVKNNFSAIDAKITNALTDC
jgi:hypothetical protein